jgi:hypothetical protein
MKTFRIVALALVACCVVMLLGCTGGERKLVTINGTFSCSGWTDAATATITVTNAFGSYTTTASIPSPYTISGVPTGTYSLEIVFDSSYPSSSYNPPSCTIGSDTMTLSISDDGGPTTYKITETVSGVTINDSETIDIDMGGLPPA